ncbi:MAG: hypothetical protein WBA22_14735 [Candidatus Methanofastidiosia archaeon]
MEFSPALQPEIEVIYQDSLPECYNPEYIHCCSYHMGSVVR